MKRSRRKSRVAKSKPRSRKGRFTKKRKASRARESWYGQPRRHRRAAKLGVRRKKRRASVRRVAARRRRRAAEPVMEAPRRRRRRRAAEPVMEARPRRRRRSYKSKNPWYGQPRRHRRAAKLGIRRRRARLTSRRRAPSRARARTRTRTITRYVRRCPPRKKSVRRRRRATAPLMLPPAGGDTGPYAGGEYAFENPLSGGELTFVCLVGGLGFLGAGFISRWLNTTSVATPTGATGTMINGIPIGATKANDVATLTYPGWKAIGGQAALAVAAGATAYYSHSPMVRASAQGMLVGTLLHLVFKDLATPFIAGLLKNTALGQRLLLAEIEAREAGVNGGATPTATTQYVAPAAGVAGTFPQGVAVTTASTAAGASPGTTLAGLPRGMPQALGQPYRDVGPVATPRGTGQLPSTANYQQAQLAANAAKAAAYQQAQAAAAAQAAANQAAQAAQQAAVPSGGAIPTEALAPCTTPCPTADCNSPCATPGMGTGIFGFGGLTPAQLFPD